MNSSNPFSVSEGKGYLQNHLGFTSPDAIKLIEHSAVLLNIDEAREYLHSQKTITYASFLETHKILFGDIYPWAGQDRSTTAPNVAVHKGEGAWKTMFCHPADIALAVAEGLRLAQKGGYQGIKKHPGEVMGLFAFAHPFLDGNGRVILLIHSELMHRAKARIDWASINQSDYLKALSKEIDRPGEGGLDALLLPHLGDII